VERPVASGSTVARTPARERPSRARCHRGLIDEEFIARATPAYERPTAGRVEPWKLEEADAERGAADAIRELAHAWGNSK